MENSAQFCYTVFNTNALDGWNDAALSAYSHRVVRLASDSTVCSPFTLPAMITAICEEALAKANDMLYMLQNK